MTINYAFSRLNSWWRLNTLKITSDLVAFHLPSITIFPSPWCRRHRPTDGSWYHRCISQRQNLLSATGVPAHHLDCEEIESFAAERSHTNNNAARCDTTLCARKAIPIISEHFTCECTCAFLSLCVTEGEKKTMRKLTSSPFGSPQLPNTVAMHLLLAPLLPQFSISPASTSTDPPKSSYNVLQAADKLTLGCAHRAPYMQGSRLSRSAPVDRVQRR
jgi:hypothetical protein